MLFRFLYTFILILCRIYAIDTEYDVNLDDLDQYELADQNNSILYPEITITALSACSLHVTWDCLLCQEKFVEKYTINWNTVNFENETMRQDVGNNNLYYIIDDLLADTEYLISVSSHINGKIFESIPEIGLTLEKETSEVTDLQYTKKTSSKIYLEWDETKNECPIKGYKIEYSGTVLWKESTRTGQESSKINSDVLTNLVPYTNYTIFVSKIYSDDEEGPVAVLPDIYTDEDVAECPEPITSYAINSTSIEVNWTEPLVKNGIITAYELSWQLQLDGEDDEPEVLNTTDFTSKVDDLLACGDYIFSVRAINGAGYGEQATKHETTEAEPCPSVANVTATNETSKSVYLNWIPPDTNCPVLKYTIEGYGNISWSQYNVEVNISFEGVNSSYVLKDLIPSTSYYISIKPTTEGGTGNPFFVNFKTLEDVPSKPTSLTSKSISKYEVFLSWSEPKDLNGEITSYKVTWLLNSSQYVSQVLDYNVTNFIIEDLLPCLTYDINVTAATKVGEGPPAQTSVTLNSEVPPLPKDLICNETGSTSISLQWSPPETSCNIISYEIEVTGNILWKNQNTSVNTKALKTDCLLNGLVPYTSYNISVKAVVNPELKGAAAICSAQTEEDYPGEPENLTVIDSSREKKSFDIYWEDPINRNGILKEYIIKKNNSTVKSVSSSSTGSYRVKIDDLKHGTIYNITVYAQTSKGYGNYAQAQGETLDGGHAGVIVGSIFAVTVVLVALGFGYYYRKDIKRKMRNVGTSQPVLQSEIPDDFSTSPIPLSQLRSHVHRLEDNRNLASEFNSLNTRSFVGTTTEGEKPENELKNRYANILPFDSSRTILHESHSDYINASHINSFLKPRFFIAAQGPKENTVEDFWNLLLQENVDIIVMLTACIENGQEKCSQYWPRSLTGAGSDIGNYSIQTANEEITSLFAVRVFEVTNRRNGHKRLITQFQFSAWPDFGAPPKEEYLLKLLFCVNQNLSTNRLQNKMLVHCSAGVGRTGTFICLWNAIEEIESGIQSISISNEVLELRKQRTQMVYSKEQYLYLYKCVLEYYENQEKWTVRLSDSSMDSTTEDSSASAYYNMSFDSGQDFQGNLI